jgi:outer membrane protein TolC
VYRFLRISQNFSLRVAGLRILESRALLGSAVGQQYPQVQQLNGGCTYFKSSKNAPPPTGKDLKLLNEPKW